MVIPEKFFSWIRNNEGSVAVEFALISIPFIYCTIAIIELSMFFCATNMLEGAVNQSARLIRTGQIQAQADPEMAFREAICDRLFILIDCDEVQLEVLAMPDDSFGSADDYGASYDEDGNYTPREFDSGGSGDVVLIRAYYEYQLMTPMFAQIFSTREDATVPMMSTIILQSEPYDFDGDAEET